MAVQVADMLTGDSALPEDTPLVPDVATADGAGSPLENQEVLYVSAEESIEQVNPSVLTGKALPASVSPKTLQVHKYAVGGPCLQQLKAGAWMLDAA